MKDSNQVQRSKQSVFEKLLREIFEKAPEVKDPCMKECEDTHGYNNISALIDCTGKCLPGHSPKFSEPYRQESTLSEQLKGIAESLSYNSNQLSLIADNLDSVF